MSTYYALIEGNGDTITCDTCSKIVPTWWTDGSHAICWDCCEERNL